MRLHVPVIFCSLVCLALFPVIYSCSCDGKRCQHGQCISSRNGWLERRGYRSIERRTISNMFPSNMFPSNMFPSNMFPSNMFPSNMFPDMRNQFAGMFGSRSICQCETGWTGKECDGNNICYAVKPCGQNGICRTSSRSPHYRCLCNRGYEGQKCQNKKGSNSDKSNLFTIKSSPKTCKQLNCQNGTCKDHLILKRSILKSFQRYEGKCECSAGWKGQLCETCSDPLLCTKNEKKTIATKTLTTRSLSALPTTVPLTTTKSTATIDPQFAALCERISKERQGKTVPELDVVFREHCRGTWSG